MEANIKQESVCKKDLIKLNVGGVNFDTTKTTLKTSKYFEILLKEEWVDKTEERHFVDRSGIIFEHVLCLLRNPNYLYPEEYVDELGFYMIDNFKLRPSNTSIMKKLNELEARLIHGDKNLVILSEVIAVQGQKIHEIRTQSNICADEKCTNKRFETFPYCLEHGKFVPDTGGVTKRGFIVQHYKNKTIYKVSYMSADNVDCVELSNGKWVAIDYKINRNELRRVHQVGKDED